MLKREKKLSVSKTLIEERINKKNTQKELAVYCGVTTSAVSKWEQGLAYPKLIQLPQIASFYNITIQRLLTGS